ncbi:carboxymuconolactone decarboxylase family protein [Brevibacillus ruminantium]|uniref:Carboxymuconolactone decarboxylase family protein n=2 Tax=Brevibacillus ruminantium TaxID=2950604 RepID=A0ABY4WJB6_9BACL|nr:carboxymuconolactone decarboxylase family protein [Brevibacillus ruminantium]USG64751.1 carboxymuconolactone decarboxylase family protein [Brevibacillus ruminantium]
MNPRMEYRKANPQAFQAMLQMEKHVRSSGLDHSLLELVKIRASQINGCAYCLDMHTQEARQKGESEQRLYLLNAWREAAVYTEAERAALTLTEAVTLISKEGVPENVFQNVQKHFSDAEIVSLLMAINTINSWNRLAIATGMSAPAELPPAL